MVNLCNLIINNRSNICENVLMYANKYNLLKYYKKVPKSVWFNPIDTISTSICLILKENIDYTVNSNSENLYKLICKVGINNLLTHYNKSVDMGTVLLTIKCYRQSYLDIILNSNAFSDKKIEYIDSLGVIFDTIEIMSCNEWSKTSNSEIKFNALSEITSAFIFIHDFKNLIYINSAVEEFTGYTKDELFKINLEDLNNSLSLKQLDNLSSNHDSNSSIREFKIFTKDKCEKWIEFSQCEVSFSGKPLMLGIAFDITKRKETEAENLNLQHTIECDKLKNQFFANLSHEFRTPLNVIMSSIQLMDMLMPNDQIHDFKKYISIMKQNCYRLSRLINNLLDITEIERGHMGVCFEKADIISYIEDITFSTIKYAKNKGVTTIFDTEIEEKIIAFDKDKVARILLNLLSNSIKFTNPGGYIYVNLYLENNFIVVSIKDTGVGIPKEKQKIIFDKFTRLDRSFSRKQEGSGIGLAIAKSLVEIHKGKIYLNDKFKEGTEFIIKLPTDLSVYKNCDHKHQIEDYVDKVNTELSDIY